MTENTHERVPEVVDAVYSTDSRRVLATLVRLLGTFDLSEKGRIPALMGILPEVSAFVVRPCKIAIKTNGRILFVDPAEVTAVESQGNYVLLQRQAVSHLLRGSISTLAEKLGPHGFIRIHRSVLVNAACVQEIQPRNRGEYLLRIRGGKEYTVTPTYRENLRAIAHLWIGSEVFLAK